jgi:hypothetical protein
MFLYSSFIFTFLSLTSSISSQSSADLRTRAQIHSLVRKEPSDHLDPHILIFAIRQRNLHILEAELYQRSDIRHPLYGQWFSKNEIETIIDCDASHREVLRWLESLGISIKEENGDNIGNAIITYCFHLIFLILYIK